MNRGLAASAAAGAVYVLFAASCFRLAAIHGYERGISIGEGLFTLVGAAAFLAAVLVPSRRAAIVVLGTVPLVGWFVATPWNSGPPFLVASAIAPFVAAAVLAHRAWMRHA
jgi:hypothetical protein